MDQNSSNVVVVVSSSNPKLSAQQLRVEHIVYGYLRQELKNTIYRTHKHNDTNTIVIPDDIKQVICLFFLLSFEWALGQCREPRAECLEFDAEDPSIIKHIQSAKWAMICLNDREQGIGGTQVLSIDACDPQTKQFEWEFTLVASDSTYYSFMFGFVSSDTIPEEHFSLSEHINDSSKIKDLALQPCGVQVFTNYDKFHLYGGSAKHTGQAVQFANSPEKKIKFAIGDRFGLRFDFALRECSLYYNGEFVTTVYRDIPEKVCLLLSMYYMTTFKCTKFNPFHV